MDLWFRVHFLLAGLYLSSSAPTPEDCQRLLTPLSLSDPSMIYGKFNFIMGYTDYIVYNNMIKVTDSSWLKISPSPNDVHGAVMSQGNRINGTCFTSKVNVTIEGNTATALMVNITTTVHLLQSFPDCLTLGFNTTISNIDHYNQLMKLNMTVPEENTVHAIYLMCKESSVKDSDLESVKEQAGCLGFTGEQEFLYDPKKGFCAEGEGIRIP